VVLPPEPISFATTRIFIANCHFVKPFKVPRWWTVFLKKRDDRGDQFSYRTWHRFRVVPEDAEPREGPAKLAKSKLKSQLQQPTGRLHCVRIGGQLDRFYFPRGQGKFWGTFRKMIDKGIATSKINGWFFRLLKSQATIFSAPHACSPRRFSARPTFGASTEAEDECQFSHGFAAPKLSWTGVVRAHANKLLFMIQ
jgi:hypothetical protein